MEVIEGKAKIKVCDKVFYNPFSKVLRDIAVSAFKAINKKDSIFILDAFTATGVRGIRYVLEGNCKASFLDISENAVKCCKENLIKNGIEAEVIKSDVNAYVLSSHVKFNAIEIDPFGSPVPYLWPCIKALSEKKHSYLSVTATDLQVLCGLNKNAAKKYYQAEIERINSCHEMALRVLIKKIAEIAIEQNAGIVPIISFYHRHSIKAIVKILRGDKHARETLKNIEKVSIKNWENGKNEKAIGPLWIGKLKDNEIVNELEESNDKSGKIIRIIKKELDTLFFYTTEEISKALKINEPRAIDIVKALKENGYKASLTHFSSKGFKTDANFDDVLKLVGKINEMKMKR
jgi:tRNA (guanine26-N2/guanine27-N2)-dimethyltransferase